MVRKEAKGIQSDECNVGKAKGNVADTEKVMQGLAHKPLQAGDGISYSDAAVYPHVADETCSLFREF